MNWFMWILVGFVLGFIFGGVLIMGIAAQGNHP